MLSRPDFSFAYSRIKPVELDRPRNDWAAFFRNIYIAILKMRTITVDTDEELEAVLNWMDANTDGKPYGVDVVMPAKLPTEDAPVDIGKLVPQTHRDFVAKTLADLGVPPLRDDETGNEGVLGWLHSVARSHVDVALGHRISLIANALGSPPADVVEQAHAVGVPLAALAGTAVHARRHVDNGVDIVVAQGYEAGGHTGEIASMVLVPEVVDAVGATPVLAAGGIGSGRQVAAALALGASGVWMGSAFLTAAEYDLGTRGGRGPSVIQQALLAATSSDTVRRRIYSGKPARLLKSRWTDAWDSDGAPDPLPMPLQNVLVAQAHQRMSQSQDPSVVAMPVGQIVGRMNQIRPAAEIIAELVSGYDAATRRLDDIRG